MKYLVLILTGGVLGGIATLIYAFQFDNVPTTNNGVNGVLAVATPIGVVCGNTCDFSYQYRLRKRGEMQSSRTRPKTLIMPGGACRRNCLGVWFRGDLQARNVLVGSEE